jgi:nitroreductase
MKSDENPVMANIKTRRSVREYLDTPLSEETIKNIIDAGRYAPTRLKISICSIMRNSYSCDR